MSDIPMPAGLTTNTDTYTQSMLSEITFIADYLRDSNIVRENKELQNAIRETTEAVQEDKKDQKEDREETKKESKKMFSEFFTSFKKTTTEVLNKSFDLGFQTLLGPLNLVAEPLKEFGIDFNAGFKKVGETLLPKPFKGSPKRNKILKIDPGAVYLADMWGAKNKDDEKKIGGLLEKFGIKGGLSGLGSKILTGGAIALIIGGLVWAGINAFQGWVKSQDWGTSKISGAIGGFLAGTGSGWKGAFKNFGKWALIGAGTGFLVYGPVGAIVGGLIGASIGAILGFIGGEKIAKGFDNVKNSLNSLWKDNEKGIIEKLAGSVGIIGNAVLSGLTEFFATIPTMIFSIFVKDKSRQKEFHKKSKAIIGWFIGSFYTYAGGWIIDAIKSFGVAFTKAKNSKEKGVIKKLGVFIKTFIGDFLQTMFKRFLDPLKRLGSYFFNDTKVGQAIKDITKTMTGKISGFFTGIFGKIIGKKNLKMLQNAIADPFGTVLKLFETFKLKIMGFFRTITDYFEYIGNEIKEKGVVKGLGSLAVSGVGGLKEYKIEKYTPQAERLTEVARRSGDRETVALARELETAIVQQDPTELLSKMDELIAVMKSKGFDTTIINNDNRYTVGATRKNESGGGLF